MQHVVWLFSLPSFKICYAHAWQVVWCLLAVLSSQPDKQLCVFTYVWYVCGPCTHVFKHVCPHRGQKKMAHVLCYRSPSYSLGIKFCIVEIKQKQQYQ